MFDDAIKMFDKALIIDKNNAEIYNNKGGLIQNFNNRKCIESIRKA